MSQSSSSPIGGQGVPAGQSPDEATGGYIVMLAFQADGSIQIGMQDGSDDSGNGNDSNFDNTGEGQVQTVDSLDAAFQAVAQIAAENGYADAGADSGSEGDVGEDSGSDAEPDADFGSAGGGDAPMAPADARKLWNRMAAKKDKARAGGF